MSETINPNTGRSDADVYQEAEDVLARATALLNKTVSRPDLNTGGGTGNFTYDFGNTNSDDVLNSLLTQAGETANKEIDEDKIRRDTLRLFQSEIDATNNIYDDLVNRQEQVNANNEGGLRAIQNRQGLVGSGRGAAQTQEQRDQGQQAIGAINAERATRISNILGTARKEALDEITAKRQAQQAGASAYLTYIEMEDERKQGRLANVITALINQGIDPSEMSEQELSQVARNIGVPVQDLLSGYKTATADQRAAEQASSREAAIVGLMQQGVTDPKELFDYLNYDEQGNRIGDITLEEINAVTSALSKDDDAFNLSQGQARYVRQPDGTYVRVAYNPKTYAPDGGDGFGSGSGTGADVPTFEEYVAQREQEEQQNFAPFYRDSEIRAEYDELYGNRGAITSVGKLTPTNKNDLLQAGLDNADPLAQSYFLNTDSSFREFYSRGVASGDFSANASLDDIDAAYTQWYEEKEADKDPFQSMSTAEMLQFLNEN